MTRKKQIGHKSILRIIAACLLVSTILFFTPVADLLLPDVSAASDSNPIADIWRQVREGQPGYTAVSGQETDVLIEGSGENWRQLRNGPLATLSAWLQGITVLALTLFFLVRGKVRLTEKKTGQMVHRWSLTERLLHWYTAILFIMLSITGLSLLYGRAVLIPFIGHESFALYAQIAKQFHNFGGLMFIAGLFMMIVLWLKDNLPNRLDIEWFKAFGGMIGDHHPSAERMNGGEKAWFWLLCFAGIGVVTTGLLLDFPNIGLNRLPMQISHLIHVSLAVVLIVGSLGHIYIGTIGTEGAFEGMISGKVDSSWAKQHHDLWYEEIVDNSKIKTSDSPLSSTVPKRDRGI